MKRIIRISSEVTNDIMEQNFCNEAEKVNGDVTCSRGKYSVDGKSILGIMYLFDLGAIVTVEYPDDAVEFDKFLDAF
jgi:hypothetical protein